tara:strand:- start:394 stop:573 length:180 start_codon:yes stop_codon:yes gene_type:complete
MKELLMSILTKNNKETKQQVLSSEELEFLLKLVAESKFDGKDVQLVYSTAVKLQQIITG